MMKSGPKSNLGAHIHKAFIEGIGEEKNKNVSWVAVLNNKNSPGIFNGLDPSTLVPHQKENYIKCGRNSNVF